jgi:hypothetical protein
LVELFPVTGTLIAANRALGQGGCLRNQCGDRALKQGRCVMDQKPYPAEKARGGEIILNTPPRRAIFLSGLIVAFVLVMIMVIVR